MDKKVLTDRALRALRPAAPGRRDMHWDAALNGFGVRVSDKGAATFLVMRRLGKAGPLKRRVIGLNWTVPLAPGARVPTPLAEARERATRALEEMKAGVDPADAAERRADNCFKAVAEQFIAEHVVKRKLRRGDEVTRMIETRLIPLWAKRPVGEITRAEIARLLADIARDHPYAAHHVHAYLRLLFNWAVSTENYRLETSPVDRISAKHVIGVKHPRQRVLDDSELRFVWRATAPAGPLGVPLAPFVRMLLLTGQRLREAAEATWSEFDLEQGLWTIEPSRMKANAAHEVPLPAAAIELLKTLPRGAGPFVFSTTDGHRPISGFSKLKARLDRSLEGIAPWRFHDLRRTVRTRLGGLPVPTNVAELVIAHAQPGLHKVYDRYSYRDEKRRALTLWQGDLMRIAEPETGGNVVALARTAS